MFIIIHCRIPLSFMYDWLIQYWQAAIYVPWLLQVTFLLIMYICSTCYYDNVSIIISRTESFDNVLHQRIKKEIVFFHLYYIQKLQVLSNWPSEIQNVFFTSFEQLYKVWLHSPGNIFYKRKTGWSETLYYFSGFLKTFLM